MFKERLMPSRRDKGYLDLALRVAQASDCSQKHGAVVVKGGRVLAVGVNKFRNNPAFVESDNATGRGTIFSVHAEVDSLSRVADARGAVMYIARAGKSGPALSRPCENCTEELIAAGIKAVSYTT